MTRLQVVFELAAISGEDAEDRRRAVAEAKLRDPGEAVDEARALRRAIDFAAAELIASSRRR